MKIVVGLGNPGAEYAGTRHNLGFEVIDEIARRWNARLKSWKSVAAVAVMSDRGVVLAKPRTFMNASGRAVGEIAAYHRIEPADVLVIVDEINLPLGRVRARRAGSAGGHNGMKSIIEVIGSDFPRLRIGVGRGPGSAGGPGSLGGPGGSDSQTRWDLVDHVLSKFAPEERPDVSRAIGRAADAVEVFVDDGIEQTMNRFNAAEDLASEQERG